MVININYYVLNALKNIYKIRGIIKRKKLDKK